MLRFSYETLTNSWFYGEWIVKIIAKVMILIIHFVLHKKRRETMKDDKKEKSEQRYMERIRLIKDRVVNTRPAALYQKSKGVPQTMQRENGKDLGSGIDRGVFGNDNEATNEIAGEMFTFIANEIESYRSKFGTITPGILPVSGNRYRRSGCSIKIRITSAT